MKKKIIKKKKHKRPEPARMEQEWIDYKNNEKKSNITRIEDEIDDLFKQRTKLSTKINILRKGLKEIIENPVNYTEGTTKKR